MKIQILGTGCPKCKKLAEITESVAKEIGIDYEIENVTDIVKIMSFGVMSTPALAVDGNVKIAGSVPSSEKIKELLTSNTQDNITETKKCGCNNC